MIGEIGEGVREGDKKGSVDLEEGDRWGKVEKKKRKFYFCGRHVRLLHCEPCVYHRSLAHVASELWQIFVTHCYYPL